MFMKTATFSLAAAALAFAPAVSAKDDTPHTTGVTYADLDLSTEQGVAELDRRIAVAARQVCGMDKTNLGTRIASRESRKCFRDAKRQLHQHFADMKRDTNYGG